MAEAAAKKKKSDKEDPLVTVANRLAREVWATEYRKQNPQATTADVDKAWTGVVGEARKSMRTVLRRMVKKGITFSIAPGAAAGDDDAA
jgi:hypothetical protein